MKSPIDRIGSGSVVAGFLIASLLAGCSSGSPAVPQSAPVNPASIQQTLPSQSSATTADPYATWRTSVMHTDLPTTGCFHASYPSYTWTSIACSTPPDLLYPNPATSGAHSEIRVDSVGNGDDYTADTGSNVMSEAIGAFPVVTGVSSVKSVENPEFGGGGENGTNSYTLQLNSYFFSTSACGSIKNCEGWEQFVYENPPGSSEGQLFIQDWLVPTTESGLSGCPSGKGWEFADGGCVQNSPKSVNIPNVAIKNLGELTETGEAASSGDSVYLAVGSDVYGMKNIQGDGITDLAANWKGAEFNVIGNAGGDIADFNSGSTVEVSLETDTGVTTAPTCPANSGTTGESNNLSFVKAPSSPSELEYPSILFTESNVSGGGTASCDTVKGE